MLRHAYICPHAGGQQRAPSDWFLWAPTLASAQGEDMYISNMQQLSSTEPNSWLDSRVWTKFLFRNSSFFWNFSSATISYSSAITLQKLFRDLQKLITVCACFEHILQNLYNIVTKLHEGALGGWGLGGGWVGGLLTYLVTATLLRYIVYTDYYRCPFYYLRKLFRAGSMLLFDSS